MSEWNSHGRFFYREFWRKDGKLLQELAGSRIRHPVYGFAGSQVQELVKREKEKQKAKSKKQSEL